MSTGASGGRIVGRLATGSGRGTYFTRLDWARRQFLEKLGIDPFPGTINLILEDPDSIGAWEDLKATSGIPIDNPNDGPNDCDARCYPCSIEGRIEAAIVLPDVTGYSPGKVELIAATGVRDALDLRDGDLLTLELR